MEAPAISDGVTFIIGDAREPPAAVAGEGHPTNAESRA